MLEKFYPSGLFSSRLGLPRPLLSLRRNEKTYRIYRSESTSKIPPAGERHRAKGTWTFLPRKSRYVPHLRIAVP